MQNKYVAILEFPCIVRFMAGKAPKTSGIAFTPEDWEMLRKLKIKTGIFQTSALIRHALRQLAQSKGK
jgi:hypothetical protein